MERRYAGQAEGIKCRGWMMRRGKWSRYKEGGENSLEGLKNEDG